MAECTRGKIFEQCIKFPDYEFNGSAAEFSKRLSQGTITQDEENRLLEEAKQKYDQKYNECDTKAKTECPESTGGRRTRRRKNRKQKMSKRRGGGKKKRTHRRKRGN
jgi:hypothetical protein